MDSSETNEGTSISVVTVTFNSEDHIGGCIASVARNAAGMAVEHVVIDNASKDATARIVTDQFPSVIFVQNELNRGLTVANNQGTGLARGRYVVFLNPDTIVPDGTFRTMLDIMERTPGIGVLAPRLVDEHRRFLPAHMGHRAPTAWTLINTFLLLNRLSDDIFPGILRSKDVRGLEDCDWACGACLMVRRDVANNFPWREFGIRGRSRLLLDHPRRRLAHRPDRRGGSDPFRWPELPVCQGGNVGRDPIELGPLSLRAPGPGAHRDRHCRHAPRAAPAGGRRTSCCTCSRATRRACPR